MLTDKQSYKFKAKIYVTGINWCVDVPERISSELKAGKGYVRIKGTINGFEFDKSLVPVKNNPYRLFVNSIMMKGAKTAVGKTAEFEIREDERKPESVYPMPEFLEKILRKQKLLKVFESMTMWKKKEVLRYLYRLKSQETIDRNVRKLIVQLKSGTKDKHLR
ncbi:YdeI/OmpD-associated family protein [Pollutibacter soli]|uniref:YdeI/OmpD-associated family protein n=1 Tax=Pollutibacter soli TaxID=3034157 RepID=UPI0030136B09